MNTTTTERSDGVTKTMATVGFLAVIIFGVWLAVQIVQLIPNAFSSLASIADGVYNNRPESTITVAANENIITTSDALKISWTDVNQAGAYTFSYQCNEGVALDIRNAAGAIVAVDCDSPVNLGSDVTSIDIIANSEKKRFVDVRYIITFIPTDASAERISQDAKLTVVNPSIPQSVAVVDTDSTDETDTTEPDGTVAGENTSTDDNETPAVTPQPTVTETPIFAIPTSDPNGFADLAVRFLGVGTMDSNNNFTRTATIDNDVRGAFQFEVKNIGTKTSEDWEFVATLTSGTEFEADNQTPLKPNERSVITLGFDAVGETGIQFFGATVDSTTDSNESNNDFSWAVEVTS